MRTTRYFLCRSKYYDLYKIKVNFCDNEITGVVASCLSEKSKGFMLTNRGNIHEVDIMGLEIITVKGTFTIECECFHNIEPIYL